MTDEEFWIYLLKECKNLKDIPAKLKGQPSFDAFYKGARLAGYSAKEIFDYEKEMMLRLDIENSKREAVEKASKESFAKGEAKGKAEGMLEVARAMKAAGEAEEKISAYTGLSADVLQKL